MKRWLFLMILVLMIGISCTVMPTKKVDYYFPKTNEISIDKVEVFEGLKRDSFTGQVKDIGKPVDVDNDVHYQKLVSEYLKALKTKLSEEGFVIIEDKPTSQSLILKTKINDDKPIKGLGWTTFGQGTVLIETSVYQNETMLLSFSHAANYSIFSIETQVKR